MWDSFAAAGFFGRFFVCVCMWIGLFNLAFLLVQMIIRKRRLKKRVVMFQFITAVALGLFTDLGLDALSDYYHRSYRAELLSCVGASALLALGFDFCRHKCNFFG